jgi:hypothetical protein
MIWGYLAQALNLGGGLLLLPISARFLSPEDLGLWFVFSALAGLAQLLELGFQPTFARNAAYVYAGAQQLVKTGLPERSDNDDPAVNLGLLSGLLAAARTVYRSRGSRRDRHAAARKPVHHDLIDAQPGHVPGPAGMGHVLHRRDHQFLFRLHQRVPAGSRRYHPGQ